MSKPISLNHSFSHHLSATPRKHLCTPACHSSGLAAAPMKQSVPSICLSPLKKINILPAVIDFLYNPQGETTYSSANVSFWRFIKWNFRTTVNLKCEFLFSMQPGDVLKVVPLFHPIGMMVTPLRHLAPIQKAVVIQENPRKWISREALINLKTELPGRGLPPDLDRLAIEQNMMPQLLSCAMQQATVSLEVGEMGDDQLEITSSAKPKCPAYRHIAHNPLQLSHAHAERHEG